MAQRGETGMLYFLYNQDIISVLVCHDIQKGEFVLQIPYYPDIQNFKTDFAPEKCREMVLQSLFSKECLKEGRSLELNIVSTNTWVMEGMVSDKMQDSFKNPRVFLAGDSAHAFPPSGGFGMNAGIQDGFNLAHKIKSAENGASDEFLALF
jgi:2-polyprenyl-6-methoxyphenol hydroxylase-like FAD-dependent oxidoreductase